MNLGVIKDKKIDNEQQNILQSIDFQKVENKPVNQEKIINSKKVNNMEYMFNLCINLTFLFLLSIIEAIKLLLISPIPSFCGLFLIINWIIILNQIGLIKLWMNLIL